MARTARPRSTRSPRPGDRGMATVELLGWMFVVIILLTAGVQTLMWAVAAYGANLAADRAAQAARVYGASAADGQDEAYQMLNTSVGRGLQDATVTVTRTATTVTVQISGHAKPLFGDLALPVTVTVTVPVERPT